MQALGGGMDRIGVIGLGRMGRAIAARLAASGRPVVGWTRSGRSVPGLAIAPDLAHLVAQADVLVLSLFDDAAVAEMLAALTGGPLDGRLIVETSTITPATLTGFADPIAQLGADLVDAPISGGPDMVLAGTCGLFLGGAHAAVARAQAVLAPLSGRIFHVGPLGSGLVMKSINNAMMQSYFAALAEQVAVARQAGLPLDTVLSILAGGPAGAPVLKDRLARMLGQDHSVGFPIAGVAKDNAVFRRIAADFGVETPTLLAARAQIAAAMAAGWGDADVAALIARAYGDAARDAAAPGAGGAGDADG
ncbi:MAG: hypothetical protein RLZZ491_2027 [Pseudomonadota bacterium]|jgi:3-hydroxyisobutyrate dehydrogenase